MQPTLTDRDLAVVAEVIEHVTHGLSVARTQAIRQGVPHAVDMAVDDVAEALLVMVPDLDLTTFRRACGLPA